MTNRIPTPAIAFAIAEERRNWTPENSTHEARFHISEALDRLAHSLALTAHPDHRADFLQRAGVTS